MGSSVLQYGLKTAFQSFGNLMTIDMPEFQNTPHLELLETPEPENVERLFKNQVSNY